MPRIPKLSDLQRVVLANAAQHDDRHVLPLPASIADDERTRTQIAELIKRKLLAETPVSACVPHWREEADQRISLMVTAAGCAAVGIDLADSKTDLQSADEAAALAAALPGHAVPGSAAPRPSSKRSQVIALLSRPEGATLSELCEHTGWLPHSARAFLTGLRKSGNKLERTRNEDVTRYVLTETINAER